MEWYDNCMYWFWPKLLGESLMAQMLYQLWRVLYFCGPGDMPVPVSSCFPQSFVPPSFFPQLLLPLVPDEIVSLEGIKLGFWQLELTLLFLSPPSLYPAPQLLPLPLYPCFIMRGHRGVTNALPTLQSPLFLKAWWNACHFLASSNLGNTFPLDPSKKHKAKSPGVVRKGVPLHTGQFCGA